MRKSDPEKSICLFSLAQEEEEGFLFGLSPPVVKIHEHLKHIMFMSKNRRLVSLRYSFREHLSLASSCSESGDGLNVGASSTFWEPWARLSTRAEQFCIPFTKTGFTAHAMQRWPARFRSAICERSFCPGGCSLESCPGHFCSNSVFWLSPMCRIGTPFVFLPVEAARGGRAFIFCRPSSTPGFLPA